MATALRDLPRYLVLEPVSTVRLEIHLAAPACEIDVELENPQPGRSFVLLIGHKQGPYVQRVRLAGRARIHFDPQAPGDYLLLLANPNRQPLVLRIRARDIGATARATVRRPKRRSTAHSLKPKARAATRHARRRAAALGSDAVPGTKP
jgi:hypothetical protein